MNKILLLIFLVCVGFLIYLVVGTKESFQNSGLYQQNAASDSCKQQCTDMHPEAARMDLDADNSVADEVMGKCMQECQSQQSVCSSCA